MSFVQRLVNYLAQELIVNRLAKSKVFQRGAVRAHETISHMSSVSKESSAKALDAAQKSALSQEARIAHTNVKSFFAQLKEDVLHDVNHFSKKLGSK